MRILRSIAIGAAVLIASAASADAQTIGFKAGASMSKLSVDGDTEVFDFLTKFSGGGFIRFDFGRLGIQPEILTITKGAEIDGGDGAPDEALELEYVAIPVLLHFPITYGTSFTPYLIAGPEFAFDIGCDRSFGDEEFDCEDDALPEDERIARKSIDIGLSAGGGLAFAMGPGALLVEGRYTWGLTNIDDSADEVEVKNRSILLYAGYSIPIGRR